MAPAQYWHDPWNRETFISGSHFLADINNELEEKNSYYREALLNLTNLVLVKWSKDSVVIPSMSAHFGFYSPEQDDVILSLNQLSLYKEDWLGLRTLDQTGRLHLREVMHLSFSLVFMWFLFFSCSSEISASTFK